MNKINWIECNLPFDFVSLEGKPKYPYDLLIEKGKKIFGERFGARSGSDLIEPEEEWMDWEESQPEVIEYDKMEEKYQAELKLKSFCRQGLNISGTLIETEDKKYYLLGDLNESGGSDPDNYFNDKTIIKRYAVVFDMEEINL